MRRDWGCPYVNELGLKWRVGKGFCAFQMNWLAPLKLWEKPTDQRKDLMSARFETNSYCKLLVLIRASVNEQSIVVSRITLKWEQEVVKIFHFVTHLLFLWYKQATLILTLMWYSTKPILKTSLRIREMQCRVMGRQGLVHRVPSTKEMHFSCEVLVCDYNRKKYIQLCQSTKLKQKQVNYEITSTEA